jgi:hypothetical protein
VLAVGGHGILRAPATSLKSRLAPADYQVPGSQPAAGRPSVMCNKNGPFRDALAFSAKSSMENLVAADCRLWRLPKMRMQPTKKICRDGRMGNSLRRRSRSRHCYLRMEARQPADDFLPCQS